MQEHIDGTHFILRDPRGNEWKVELTSGTLEEGSTSSGMRMRLHGEMVGEDTFIAEGILPDKPQPPFGRRPGMMRRKF